MPKCFFFFKNISNNNNCSKGLSGRISKGQETLAKNNYLKIKKRKNLQEIESPISFKQFVINCITRDVRVKNLKLFCLGKKTNTAFKRQRMRVNWDDTQRSASKVWDHLCYERWDIRFLYSKISGIPRERETSPTEIIHIYTSDEVVRNIFSNYMTFSHFFSFLSHIFVIKIGSREDTIEDQKNQQFFIASVLAVSAIQNKIETNKK